MDSKTIKKFIKLYRCQLCMEVFTGKGELDATDYLWPVGENHEHICSDRRHGLGIFVGYMEIRGNKP